MSSASLCTGFPRFRSFDVIMMAIEQVLVGVNCVLTPLLCTFIVYTSDNGSIDTLSVSWSIVLLADKISRYHIKLYEATRLSPDECFIRITLFHEFISVIQENDKNNAIIYTAKRIHRCCFTYCTPHPKSRVSIIFLFEVEMPVNDSCTCSAD